MKPLRDILYRSRIVATQGDLGVIVRGIAFDSRVVETGYVFVAVRGTQVDGHDYIDQAIQRGCIAVIYEHSVEVLEAADVVRVKVSDSSEALGTMASEFYGNPSSELALVGITGTNGKTTIATLLHDLFERMGFVSGLISTIENKIGEDVVKSTHTTPDSVQINVLLRQMVDRGVSHCFMEVSSHAVIQRRIQGLRFTGGVFTNLTRDHLDYHGSFDAYRDAKKLFFDTLSSDAFSLVNTDDKNGRVMVQNTLSKVYRYSLQGLAEFKAKVIECEFSGLKLDLDGVEFWSKLVGRFNAYNLLAIYGTARLLGVDKNMVLEALSQAEPARGRFQSLRSPEGVVAIVDYAHTPDALLNVLQTIQDVRSGNEKLIVVVGAGGDRDKGKRPMMAKISVKLADQVILTSDNPRSEDPESIIEQMLDGVDVASRRKVLKITDRREAIRTAVTLAKSNDIILVAGKGHEDYQEVRGVRHPFDDRKIIEEAFEN